MSEKDEDREMSAIERAQKMTAEMEKEVPEQPVPGETRVCPMLSIALHCYTKCIRGRCAIFNNYFERCGLADDD